SAPALPTSTSTSDLNALAHGLAQPSTSPSPTISPTGPSKPASNGIIAVGPDAGAAPTVKVYDASTLKLKFTISAYARSFTGGVRVAVGVNGDGTSEIITVPGPGGCSLSKVWVGGMGSLLQSLIVDEAC